MKDDIVGIVQDITDQKKAEETIRDRERYFRSIIASMHEDIFVVNTDFRISDVNRDFLDTIRQRREDVVGRYCYEVLQQYHRPCSMEGRKCALQKIFRTGEPVSYKNQLTRADGANVELSGICSPLKDETGKVTHVIIALRDISNEKRLETELRQAQKMEAIGTLAGGVAHDFNNILGIILGYSELTSSQLSPDSREYANLSQVQKTCMRGKELVRQILAFSRKSKQEKCPLHIGTILKEAVKLLRSALPASIEIEQSIPAASDMDLIMADATHMHQVIMNLCTNASHAMSESGGILEVTLSNIAVNISDLPRYPELLPGEYVKMSFRDTGHGIAPWDMERIFEPYFTTKGPGQGTGLGLAVVHGIVKDHKGAVQVHSDPGKGTIFNIYLPRIIAGEPLAPQDSYSVNVSGTESILLVDDEKPLAEVYCKMLVNLGYKVVGKTDSMEAIEAFRNSPGSFDLVISDQTMPRMTGLELARQIAQISPKTPVILCSGYSDVLNEDSAREAGVREVLMKPLLLRHVAKTIRKILDETKD
ncbi:MAG: ATP-binding protein [Syntrophobacteraceae bacterium]